MILAAWTLRVDARGWRIWSGTEPIELDGETYVGGGHVITIAPIDMRSGDTVQRVEVTVEIAEPSLRAALLEDFGNSIISIRWWVGADGETLRPLPRQITGRVSQAGISSGRWTAEIETAAIPSGDVVTWSHALQQRRFPGDRGMEGLQELAGGSP